MGRIILSSKPKKCIKCGKLLGSHNKSGYCSFHKVMAWRKTEKGRKSHIESNRKYEKNHPEKRKEFSRNYYLKHREEILKKAKEKSIESKKISDFTKELKPVTTKE
jgi:hypothetical protein